MKKILTLLAVVAIGTSAFAQTRNVDLSSESLISPTVLNSTPSAGTPVVVHGVIKNNGADTLVAGDSIWWNFLVVQGNTILTGYPSNNQNNFNVKVLTKDMLPGDTMHILTGTLTIPLKVNVSINVDIYFAAHALNRPGLTFEATANQVNNVKKETITWFDEKGWPVNVNELNADANMSVYPNPATNAITIKSLYTDMNSVSTVNIYDISGKLVYSGTENTFSNQFDVNTSDFKNGVYVVEVNSGAVVSKSKVVINR